MVVRHLFPLLRSAATRLPSLGCQRQKVLTLSRRPDWHVTGNHANRCESHCWRDLSPWAIFLDGRTKRRSYPTCGRLPSERNDEQPYSPVDPVVVPPRSD